MQSMALGPSCATPPLTSPLVGDFQLLRAGMLVVSLWGENLRIWYQSVPETKVYTCIQSGTF